MDMRQAGRQRESRQNWTPPKIYTKTHEKNYFCGVGENFWKKQRLLRMPPHTHTYTNIQSHRHMYGVFWTETFMPLWKFSFFGVVENFHITHWLHFCMCVYWEIVCVLVSEWPPFFFIHPLPIRPVLHNNSYFLMCGAYMQCERDAFCA